MAEEFKAILTIETRESEDSLDDLKSIIQEVIKDMELAELEVDQTKKKSELVEREIKVGMLKAKQLVSRTEFESYVTFQHVAQGAKALIHAIAGMLSPVQEALIGSVFAAVETLMAIAASQYSTPYTIAFALITTAAAITLQMVGAVQVESEMAEAAAATAQAENIINTVTSIAGGWI